MRDFGFERIVEDHWRSGLAVWVMNGGMKGL